MILFGTLFYKRDTQNMINDFIDSSSIQDLAMYLAIAISIFGLSPYGVFFFRMILHLGFGTQRPRMIVKPGQTAAQQLSELAAQARTRIDEMGAYILELEEMLQSSQHRLDVLDAENDALKEHIRGMERSADKERSDRNTARADPDNIDQAFEVLGLRRGASWEAVKMAFRANAKTNHPDHGGDPVVFKQLNEAYQRLREAYGM